MRRFPIVIFLSFLTMVCRGQTFTGGGGNAGTFGATNTFTNNVTGLLGVLDGVNLGLQSLEITLNAKPINKLKLYLVAPDGTRIVISASRGINNNNVNGTITFSMDATALANHFRNWAATATPPSTPFKPDVNFYGLSNGMNPNGPWKLLASVSGFGTSAIISSWKLTFGNTNIGKAESNDECLKSTPLTEGIPLTEINTSNYSSNETDVRGQDVCATPGDYTENTAWYSFKPLCKDDKITIENSDNSGAQTAIRSSCSGGSSLACFKFSTATGSYTFNYTNYIPGQTYYLVIDGDDSYYVYLKKILWQKGTTGCPAVTIATGVINPSSYCSGSAVNIPYAAVGTFAAGNIFTAQLSDASGSFTNAVTIGTLGALLSGTINATLPANISNGAGYKIRVISSAPSSIGTASATSITIKNTPTTPTSLVGEANPCSGQTNLLYTVTSVANTVSYLWKRSSGGAFQAEIGKVDSSSIRLGSAAVNEILGVQARNECGLSGVFEKIITLATNPTMPVFKTFQTALCESASNSLFAVEPILGNNYSWKFPVGTVITSATVDSSEVKITAGTTSGLVTVTSKNGCGTLITPPKQLTINKKPTAPTAITNDNLICINKNNYSFATDVVATATQYHWTFPVGYNINNASANDSLTVFIKPSKTVGTVKVAAVNQCGRSATFEKILTIDSLPPTPVTSKPQTELCDDMPRALPSLIVNKPTTSTYTYAWTLPAFTQISSATADSATVALVLQSNINSATVTVRSRNECGLSANALSITHKYVANEPATVKITDADTAICKNASSTYKAMATNGGSAVQYNWYLGGILQTGFTGNVFTTNQIAANTTIQCKISSTLTCANPKDAVSQLLEIKIVEEPIALIDIQAQNVEVCVGESTSFLATIRNAGTMPVIKWFVNQIEIPNEQDAVFSPVTINNNDKVYATLVAAQKCTAAQSVISNTITISTVASITPTITINTSALATVCEGDDLKITAIALNVGNDFQYEWFVNDGSVANNDKTLIITVNEGINNIMCKVTTASACATVNFATSNVLSIIANPKPQSPLTILGQPELCEGDKQKIFSVTETINQKYIWSIPDFVNGTSDTNSIELDAPRAGEGLLTVFAENDCGKSDTISLPLVVIVCELLYVPNILSGTPPLTWQIEGLNNFPNAIIKVYNRWGSAVHEGTSNDKPWDGSTHGSPLPSGTYYYVIDLHDKAQRTITGSITVVR